MFKSTKRAFILAFATALYSILAILLVDLTCKCPSLGLGLVLIDLILLLLCFIYIQKGITLAFSNFTNRFQ